MSIDKVRAYLKEFGIDGRIREFDVSSATVELAAIALGIDGARIAKTISLSSGDGGCILVVTAGDYKIDNRKFKDRFSLKPKMLSHEEALSLTGHAVGGVCPFALPEGVPVYLDESLRQFFTADIFSAGAVPDCQRKVISPVTGSIRSTIASDSTRTPCARRRSPPSWNPFSITMPTPSAAAPACFRMSSSPFTAQPFARKSSMIRTWSEEDRYRFETMMS